MSLLHNVLLRRVLLALSITAIIIVAGHQETGAEGRRMSSAGGQAVASNSLVGVWRFTKPFINVAGSFEFKPDGTYTYRVAKGGIWEMVQTGEYEFRVSRAPQQPNEMVLVLRPETMTGQPGTLDLRGLHAERLPTALSETSYRAYRRQVAQWRRDDAARKGTAVDETPVWILHHADYPVGSTVVEIRLDEPGRRP